jgi:hypothetical protein
MTTTAKLKLVLPIIPGILSYENEFSLNTKEPIKSWKELKKIFVKKE